MACSAVASSLQAWIIPEGISSGCCRLVCKVGVPCVCFDRRGRLVNSKTMVSKRVPGLYVIGEAVDVTGWLGGYNFQWAWASGRAAAQVL